MRCSRLCATELESGESLGEVRLPLAISEVTCRPRPGIVSISAILSDPQNNQLPAIVDHFEIAWLMKGEDADSRGETITNSPHPGAGNSTNQTVIHRVSSIGRRNTLA